MNTEILTTLISGGVALVGAISAIFLTKWQTQKALHGAFATKLQELRLQHYPEAFKITERLGQQLDDPNEALPNIFNNNLESLSAWRSGVPGLILSPESIECYYGLKRALKANLAKGNRYSGEQLVKIRDKRNQFRSALRRDIGLETDVRSKSPNWLSSTLENKMKSEQGIERKT